MSNTPAWEIPFADIGKVLMALPMELAKVTADVSIAEKRIVSTAGQLVVLLSDASVAVTDKGLNFVVDAKVSNDFLTLLKQLQADFQLKGMV